MTTGSPADGPCVPAFWSGSDSLAKDHTPETPDTDKADALQGWRRAGGQVGKGALKKHPAAVFLDGKCAA